VLAMADVFGQISIFEREVANEVEY
jgi:hypothetical protein